MSNGNDEKFNKRAISPRPSTMRDDDRSVEFVISTEEPASVFDYETFDVVNEVLLQSGMRMPSNNQVPLLDSHNRSSVEDILGSLRDVRRDGTQTIGRAYFSRKQKAFDTWLDIQSGHLTDISVGYVVTKSVYIPEGQRTVIEGKEYVGALKVSTEWHLKEASLTPIGADKYAKVRAEIETAPENTSIVTDKEQDTHGQQAGNTQMEENTVDTNEITTPVVPAVNEAEIRAEAARAERERIVEIRSACKAAGIEDAAEEMITSGLSADAARKAVIEKMATSKPISQAHISMGETDQEKFRAAAVDGIQQRAGIVIAKPSAGSADFSRMSLLRIAEECVRRAGHNTRSMSNHDIAGIAMGMRAGYTIANGTGEFTHILQDAANKSIQKAFAEAPATWKTFCSVTSVSDFKNINRPQLSDAPDLALIAENGEFTEASFSDTAESYSLATYGKRFSITRKAILNDDMGAFTRIPKAFGAAAQRKIEQLVYSILTTNAVMHDGTAMFHGDHDNLLSGAAFSSDAVGAVMAALQKQTGINGAFLNLQMKYLLVPVALRFNAEMSVGSPSYFSATYNNGMNPLKEAGIVVVSSPILDASSTASFYGLADQSQIDTIEVAFLDGNQAPMLEEIEQTDVDGKIYRVRIDVGAKALDHRGMVKHAGS